MKKIFLIAIVILLSYVKGYGQLMQSNSISTLGKRAISDTIHHLNKIQSKSDSLIKIPVFHISNEYVKAINNSKAINDKIILQDEKIQELKNKYDDPKSKELAMQVDVLLTEKTALETNLKKSQDDIKKFSDTNFELHDKINGLYIDKYDTYLSVLEKDIENYKLQIDKNNKRAIAGFDTVVRSNDGKTQHLIDSISNLMQLSSFKMQLELDKMIPRRDSMKKYFQDLKQQQIDVVKYKAIKESIYPTADATIQKLVAASNEFKERKNAFEAAYNIYVENINKQIDQLNAIAKKVMKEEASSAKYASALAGVNKVFGDNGSIVPNISVVAQKKFSSDEGGSFYGEVRLFTGGNSDDKTNNGTNNLFVPEASTFGFMTDFSFGFISSHQTAKKSSITGRFEQKLGINVGVYYLGKKLQPDTVTRFNTNLFHVKLGVQYIIIPHLLSAYINTNSLLVATNVNQVEKYYIGVGKVRTFTSFGIESYLDLNDVKDFHLLLNLGFVSVNDDVRAWTKNSDSVIPNVKLSLVKTFNW